jgi:NAD-dependent SIR2 family protein deacetylase
MSHLGVLLRGKNPETGTNPGQGWGSWRREWGVWPLTSREGRGQRGSETKRCGRERDSTSCSRGEKRGSQGHLLKKQGADWAQISPRKSLPTFISHHKRMSMHLIVGTTCHTPPATQYTCTLCLHMHVCAWYKSLEYTNHQRSPDTHAHTRSQTPPGSGRNE